MLKSRKQVEAAVLCRVLPLPKFSRQIVFVPPPLFGATTGLEQATRQATDNEIFRGKDIF